MTTQTNSEPMENRSAYKTFDAPKQQEYPFKDLSNIDIDSIISNLDSMEVQSQLKFIIVLLRSQRRTQAKMELNLQQLIRGQELLVQRLVKTKNYLLSHRYKMLIKIGYSENIEHRLRKHRNNDWTVLATGEGSKEREKAMLKTLKQNGFVPEPSSEEIFTISEELVDLLCANNWVGANENKEFILDKFHQQKIFKNTF